MKPQYAFFVLDVGGWWGFKGIHLEEETVIGMLEQFKHANGCSTIRVVELSTGKIAYDWSKED
jgi:hypothetical protein